MSLPSCSTSRASTRRRGSSSPNTSDDDATGRRCRRQLFRLLSTLRLCHQRRGKPRRRFPLHLPSRLAVPAFNTSLITRIGVSCRLVRPFQPWDGSQTHPGGVSPSSSRCVDRALWSVACKSSLSRCCSASCFCFGVAVCAARCLHIAVLHCASTSAPSFAPPATFTPPSASCSNSSAAGCAAPYSSPRRLMIGGPPRPPSRFTLGQGVAAVGWGAVAASTVVPLSPSPFVLRALAPLPPTSPLLRCSTVSLLRRLCYRLHSCRSCQCHRQRCSPLARPLIPSCLSRLQKLCSTFIFFYSQ